MPSYSSSIQSHVNAATNAHQASAIGINNNALPAGVTDVEAALVSLANQVGVDVASLAAKVGSSYYTTIVRSTASEYAALKAAGTLNANTLYVVPDAIVSDTFNRTVTDGLGVADTGQTWILENTATSFQVTGTQATLQVPSANNDRLARPGLSVQDATFSLRWSGDAVPTASANSTFLLMRRSSTTQFYRLKVAIPTTGNMTAQFEKASTNTSSVAVAIGTAVTTGIAFAANTKYWTKMQVATTTPAGTSALRGRVWADGTAEPTTWLIDTTDNDNLLQGAGDVAIDFRVGSGGTPVPWTGAIDDLTVS
jgi:hypothetical protein